jgi:L-rhamnose mutarotase
MQRHGSIFRIRPEYKEEYKKAHDEIWPELAQEISKAGIKNYTIFFREDGTLFSYFETDLDSETFKKNMEEYWKKDIARKWSEYMNKYIIKTDPTIVGPESEDLEEVFHLD